MCKKCQKRTSIEDNKKKTLKEIRESCRKGFSLNWYSAIIRNFARAWNPDLVEIPCYHCGYNIHTELCHIKPISTFDESVTLGEINDRKNLVSLCPNHHWEFDHKILKLVGSPGFEPGIQL